MKIYALAALSTLMLTVVPPVLASTASASLSRFTLVLTDLDPADGIAPSVMFQDAQGGPFIAAESGTLSRHATFVQSGGTPFGNGQSSASWGSGTASASIAGDAFGGGAAAAVSAQTSRLDTYSAGSVWLGDGGMQVAFTLSPETRLTISADASVSALSTFDLPSADTWASVFLQLTDFTGLDQVSVDSLYVEQFGTGGAPPSASADARHVEISFENDATTSADGIFTGAIDASAAAIVPVPEPATVALLAGGALLLALRRRAR